MTLDQRDMGRSASENESERESVNERVMGVMVGVSFRVGSSVIMAMSVQVGRGIQTEWGRERERTNEIG